MALKFRFLDDDKVIVSQGGQRIEDFEDIIKDLKIKYGNKRGRK